MATTEKQTRAEPAQAATPASLELGEQRLPALRAPATVSPPRSMRRVWFWAVGLVLAGGAGIGLYVQPWATVPVPVAVETVALAPVTRVLAVNGRLAALNSVDVRALVGGMLADVPVAEGDSVPKGAALAHIDAAAQQATVRQSVAGLDAALVAEAQANDTFVRTEALGENVARTALDTAARAVQSAQQEVARATALLDQVQAQLENYTIRAPIAGTVLTLNVDAGQSIDLFTPLMTIADLDLLVVETDVDEAYATQVQPGLPAVLQLAGETAQRNGRVSFVSQRVDAATGGLAVELRFDEQVRAPVGLTVTINIIVDSRGAALTAPRAAIQTNESGSSVFIVNAGTAQRRPVSVIEWPAARLIVTDGLAPGDVLILDATGVSEGQAVREVTP